MNKLTTLFTITILAFSSLQLKASGEDEKLDDKNDKLSINLAQNYRGRNADGIKGKIIISANAGLNFFRQGLMYSSFLDFTDRSSEYSQSGSSGGLGLFYYDNYDSDIYDENGDYLYVNSGNGVSSSGPTPLLNLGVDYAIAERVSVGLAFGYQKAVINDNFFAVIVDSTDSYGDKYGHTEEVDITDTWKRLHFAVRFDYHIVAKEEVALYTGVKMGYNAYKVTSTMTKLDPGYVDNLRARVTPSSIAAQAHLGFSVFFGGLVGINTEVGLSYGGPYNVAVGLTVKI